MSCMKSILAVVVVAAVVVIVPQAFAANPTIEVVLSGSTAFWQTAAVAAYNNGTSLVSGGGNTCHWTSGSNKIGLIDSRPALLGGSDNTDNGTLWIVWDVGTSGTCGTSAALHVWADNKVDSVIGARCFFAQPQCTILGNSNGSTGTLDGTGSNQINFAGTPWGNDTDVALPSNVLAVFDGSAGTLNKVNSAAIDIRPEDAAFAICRANSSLGSNTSGANSSDGLDGLGYNSSNAPGACPPGHSSNTLAELVGTPIKSGVLPTTGSTANPLAFSISGTDPFSGTAIPAYKVTDVGGEPVVFVTGRANSLTGVHFASAQQLADIFSGNACDAQEFGAAFSGPLNIFLREPLSGTMNTAEATLFRRPTVSAVPYAGTATSVLGTSQEANVNGPTNNPLQGQAGTCVAAGNPTGKGARYRGIGTSEVVGNGVYASNNANGGAYPNAQDGIAYTFFSYGNVKKLADQGTLYGYLALNGFDPVFSSYGNQPSGTPFDAGQPADAAAPFGPGVIPGAADLPAACEGGAGAFPCSEDILWTLNPLIESSTKTPLSFPNVRLGNYPAWSILRVVGASSLSALTTLITESNKYAVGYVPDYIPYAAVAAQTVVSHSVPADPGLKVLRSHYQQYDASGVAIGKAPVNSGGSEAGGDVGGTILPSTNTTTQEIQGPGGFQIRP